MYLKVKDCCVWASKHKSAIQAEADKFPNAVGLLYSPSQECEGGTNECALRARPLANARGYMEPHWNRIVAPHVSERTIYLRLARIKRILK
jgi:hypothetical protein